MAIRDRMHQRTNKVGDQMAFPEKLSETPNPVIKNNVGSQTLCQQAMAIDPPPVGAIGIEGLLGRFERLAEVGTLTAHSEKGVVGVRDLLKRLNNLVEEGHFSPTNDDTPDEV